MFAAFNTKTPEESSLLSEWTAYQRGDADVESTQAQGMCGRARELGSVAAKHVVMSAKIEFNIPSGNFYREDSPIRNRFGCTQLANLHGSGRSDLATFTPEIARKMRLRPISALLAASTSGSAFELAGQRVKAFFGGQPAPDGAVPEVCTTTQRSQGSDEGKEAKSPPIARSRSRHRVIPAASHRLRR